MNMAQSATLPSNDNCPELTPEAVASVMGILHSFFDGGASFTVDMGPLLPCDGIGLVAVAAAQECHARAGAWAVVDRMIAFFRAELAEAGPRDQQVGVALAAIDDLREARVDVSDLDVRDALYGTLARRRAGADAHSLLGYCMLQVAQVALWAAAHDPSPAHWPALHIANELATKVGKSAAWEFAQSLRGLGAKPQRELLRATR